MKKTIIEIAESEGVSRQAIHNRISDGKLKWQKLEAGWYSFKELLDIIRRGL